MNEIRLSGAGRRFNREWIFRDLSYTFQNDTYAVLGPNGSGKSTLMRVLSGILTPSEGSVSYCFNTAEVEPTQIFKHVSYCAPYLELPEEMQLKELVEFHFQLKPCVFSDLNEFYQRTSFEAQKFKDIRHFSSGMKQRLKLALSLFSQSELLILDEPLTNMDATGAEWYYRQIEEFTKNRIVVVCSNVEREYAFCRQTLTITDFKPGYQV